MMLSTDFTNEPAGDARARKQLADHAFCSWRAGGVLFVHERVAVHTVVSVAVGRCVY